MQRCQLRLRKQLRVSARNAARPDAAACPCRAAAPAHCVWPQALGYSAHTFAAAAPGRCDSCPFIQNRGTDLPYGFWWLW
eukprot:SAG31_NODE_43401_length_267_cov_0.619048_1_plen_79_part_01